MIANYIMDIYDKKQMKELIIYEIGPGKGALCESILVFLKNFPIKVTYNLIEISKPLHEFQKSHFAKIEPRLVKKKKINFIN